MINCVKKNARLGYSLGKERPRKTIALAEKTYEVES